MMMKQLTCLIVDLSVLHLSLRHDHPRFLLLVILCGPTSLGSFCDGGVMLWIEAIRVT